MNRQSHHPESDDSQALRLLNDWPDGTAKSFGTAFTAHFDGEKSCMCTDRDHARWTEKQTHRSQPK